MLDGEYRVLPTFINFTHTLVWAMQDISTLSELWDITSAVVILTEGLGPNYSG